MRNKTEIMDPVIKTTIVKIIEVPRNLLVNRTSYHLSAKKINPELVEKTLKNMPFSGLAVSLSPEQTTEFTEKFEAYSHGFLNRHFHSLIEFGCSADIYVTDEKVKEEAVNIEKLGKTYMDAGMEEQKKSLDREYLSLSSLRQILAHLDESIKATGLSDSCIITLNSLNSIMDRVDSVRRTNFVSNLARTIALIPKVKGVLNVPIVMPKDYLAEIFFACPVYYGYSPSWELPENRIIRFLANMYNRQNKQLKDFSGADLIPLELASKINE